MRLVLPRLYVILDAALLNTPELECAAQLADAGVRLFQYRNKLAPARELLRASLGLSELLLARGATFVMNDRPDVAYLSGASGVHVGQDDLPISDVRTIMGPDKLIGISTHNVEQVRAANETDADYIAVGPVFATTSKFKPDPVVGLEFVRQARALTNKPIVAIGGMTRKNAKSVLEAGADSLAVISDILRAPYPAGRASEFLELLDDAKPLVKN